MNPRRIGSRRVAISLLTAAAFVSLVCGALSRFDAPELDAPVPRSLAIHTEARSGRWYGPPYELPPPSEMRIREDAFRKAWFRRSGFLPSNGDLILADYRRRFIDPPPLPPPPPPPPPAPARPVKLVPLPDDAENSAFTLATMEPMCCLCPDNFHLDGGGDLLDYSYLGEWYEWEYLQGMLTYRKFGNSRFHIVEAQVELLPEDANLLRRLFGIASRVEDQPPLDPIRAPAFERNEFAIGSRRGSFSTEDAVADFPYETSRAFRGLSAAATSWIRAKARLVGPTYLASDPVYRRHSAGTFRYSLQVQDLQPTSTFEAETLERLENWLKQPGNTLPPRRVVQITQYGRSVVLVPGSDPTFLAVRASPSDPLLFAKGDVETGPDVEFEFDASLRLRIRSHYLVPRAKAYEMMHSFFRGVLPDTARFEPDRTRLRNHGSRRPPSRDLQ